MVPASMFKYGSIFMGKTESPLALARRLIEAEVIPFPIPDTIPPVIKTNFGFRFLRCAMKRWIMSDKTYFSLGNILYMPQPHTAHTPLAALPSPFLRFITTTSTFFISRLFSLHFIHRPEERRSSGYETQEW